MTVIEALSKIINERGCEILLDSRTVNSYIADYVLNSGEEIKLYKISANNGIFSIMFDMLSKSNNEEIEALKSKGIYKLISDAMMSEENARKAIELLMKGVGLISDNQNEPVDQ